MIAFAVPILEGKLEDWTNMILNTMLGDNKKATDESRENAEYMNDHIYKKCPKGTFVFLLGKVQTP